MYKFHWSEISFDRITEIGNFIALNAPMAADKWIKDILSKEELIRANLNIGRVVLELGSKLKRELIVGGYRLIYRIEGKSITVMTVLSCREGLKEEDEEI